MDLIGKLEKSMFTQNLSRCFSTQQQIERTQFDLLAKYTQSKNCSNSLDFLCSCCESRAPSVPPNRKSRVTRIDLQSMTPALFKSLRRAKHKTNLNRVKLGRRERRTKRKEKNYSFIGSEERHVSAVLSQATIYSAEMSIKKKDSCFWVISHSILVCERFYIEFGVEFKKFLSIFLVTWSLKHPKSELRRASNGQWTSCWGSTMRNHNPHSTDN